jgi:hypothetical protein
MRNVFAQRMPATVFAARLGELLLRHCVLLISEVLLSKLTDAKRAVLLQVLILLVALLLRARHVPWFA